MLDTISKPEYFDTSQVQSTLNLKKALVRAFSERDIISHQLIILCIGSDRSTGDSLGPLIGYKLSKYHIPRTTIIGTLDAPVHAANLSEYIEQINANYNSPFVLAIDASLGTKDHIGYVTLCDGPLRPGLGVKKELPSIGDIHITGIVNLSGMMETLLLQTTRLSEVMKLADTISKAILYAVNELTFK